MHYPLREARYYNDYGTALLRTSIYATIPLYSRKRPLLTGPRQTYALALPTALRCSARLRIQSKAAVSPPPECETGGRAFPIWDSHASDSAVRFGDGDPPHNNLAQQFSKTQ